MIIKTPHAIVHRGYPSTEIVLGKQKSGIIIYRITTVMWGTIYDGHTAIWGFEDKADLAEQLGKPKLGPRDEITIMEFRNGSGESQAALHIFHEPENSEPRNRKLAA